MYLLILQFFAIISSFPTQSYACKEADWRNMTLEELMFNSDIVVYGRDVDHGKFRTPSAIDARFDVYCVFKKGANIIPGQVIIEDINEGDNCSGVIGQTEEGQEYILGLTRQLSGFMKYADVNPLQKTAFPPSVTNLDKLSTTCGLDDWSPPGTGNQTRCPIAYKPRWCTKIRDPSDFGISVNFDCSRRIVLVVVLSYIHVLL